MPKKPVRNKQSKKAKKKILGNKPKKHFGKILDKKISVTSLLLILFFLVVCSLLIFFLIVHFVISPDNLESCSVNTPVEEYIDDHNQELDRSSKNNCTEANNTEGCTKSDNDQGPCSECHIESNGTSSAPNGQPQSSSPSSSSNSSSSSSSNSSSNQIAPRDSTENLKVGSSYMGGTIPSAYNLVTCYGATLCGWFLDGSDYASIYLSQNYTWSGRFLDIVGGNLVTSERDHWRSSRDKYFYSDNLPKLFSNDMVEMAKKYGLRVINKKLYMTINGTTYSFHPGYDRVIPEPEITIPNNSLSMSPNSQVDFDVNVSPWFYDPEIFGSDIYPYIYNTDVVKFIKFVKKSDGVMTLTLKSGNYPHGASTVLEIFKKQIVVYVTGH